jgi:hypothetical protein
MKQGVSYWHAYGGVVPEGEFLGGCWHQVISGPHDHAVPKGDLELETYSLPWIKTWGHEPTEEEKRALEPVEL